MDAKTSATNGWQHVCCPASITPPFIKAAPLTPIVNWTLQNQQLPYATLTLSTGCHRPRAQAVMQHEEQPADDTDAAHIAAVRVAGRLK
jgi:hypothetical protein